MREVVACLVFAGCGFTGAATNGAVGGDARGVTPIDAPAIEIDGTVVMPTDAMVESIDAMVLSIDAAVPDAAPAAYRDCFAAYQAGVHTDGPQMIQPPGATLAFTAYCDMTTPPGGWTLVAGYTFAAYTNFMSGSNAITPRPGWPLPGLQQSVPISSTAPATPADHGALEYGLWAGLGPNFLIHSNVNNWISCTAGTGTLAPLTAGTISCAVAKVVNSSHGCTTVAPAHLMILADGPILDVGSSYDTSVYYFEGSTSTGDGNWPTHDPCGTNTANQLTGVANPGGAIFLHR